MESKRRKILFGVLCAGLAVLLVFVLVYSYCAFTPSGYEEVEKPMAEARERIGKTLSRPVVHAALPAPASGAVSAVAFKSPAGEDWTREMANFDTAGDWGAQQFYQACENRMVTVQSFGLKDIDVAAPAEGAKLWPALIEKRRDMIMGYVASAFRQNQAQRVDVSDKGAAQVARELDRIEEFLLRKNRELPRGGEMAYISNMFSFKTKLAIKRACLNGDSKKALALFDGYLDLVRMIFLANLYDGMAYIYSYAPMMLLSRNLDTIPNFPGQWREHARKALAEIASFKVNEADARLYTVGAWRERCIESLNSNSNRKGNIWHYFAGGRLETVTGKAFYPIVMRQIDEAAVALSKGDDAGYRAHMNAAEPALGAMNINSMPSLSNYNTPDSKSKQLRDFVATVSEQIKPLDHATSETIEIARFGNLTNIGTLHGYDLYLAVQNYNTKHGHGPTTPEEIDAFIKENRREDWRQYVEWYGPGRVTLSWFVRGGEVMFTVQVEDKEFDEVLRRVLMTKAGGK